jgi:hypothetical protein
MYAFGVFRRSWCPLTNIEIQRCCSMRRFEECRLLGCCAVVLTRAKQRNILETGILHSHRRENLKSDMRRFHRKQCT